MLICTTWPAKANVDENVDYLLLTRDNMPSPAEVIQGCLDNLDFDSESYESYMKKKKVAAWMPLLHVGGEVQQDKLNDYDYVQNFQKDYNFNGSDNQGQTFGGQQQTGYDDSVLLDVWAQWDLRDIVYDVDQQTLINAEVSNENERHFLYAEVSKRYGQLYSLLPKETGDKIPAARAVRLLESASILDAMSGFLISDALKNLSSEGLEKTVVAPNGAIEFSPEEQDVKEPAVIEVDDGQDDTVEKAF